MDSLEKLASAAKTEIENAHFYLGKLEESLGRMACIVDNIRKKAEEANEVAEGGSPIPPKQTPPGVRISATGDMTAPNKADGPKKPMAWHAVMKPQAIVKTLVDKSSYVIPSKCVRYRMFEVDGDKFIEVRVVYHGGIAYTTVEEFTLPLVDTLDEQMEIFDRHIGSLLTVKFKLKGYADKAEDWNAI